MCGIAGVIHRDGATGVGREMTDMLQAMKHRGPDSTGFGLFADSGENSGYVLRLNLAEREDAEAAGFAMTEVIRSREGSARQRLAELGAEILAEDAPTPFARRLEIRFDGDMAQLGGYLEAIEGVEILSFGRSLELVKDLGDATAVSDSYRLGGFRGTHAIGHTRMATESDVDIRSAHPYWAFPYSDICIVHNGQVTNYWTKRRDLERLGHRFVSNCDSELLAVYTAHNLADGATLQDSLERSIKEIDGVFTYLVATRDSLGMAKDGMAAKPLVLYESDDLIALASEEVSIRAIMPQEIDTWDPYDEEVRVWQA